MQDLILTFAAGTALATLVLRRKVAKLANERRASILTVPSTIDDNTIDDNTPIVEVEEQEL